MITVIISVSNHKAVFLVFFPLFLLIFLNLIQSHLNITYLLPKSVYGKHIYNLALVLSVLSSLSLYQLELIAVISLFPLFKVIIYRTHSFMGSIQYQYEFIISIPFSLCHSDIDLVNRLTLYQLEQSIWLGYQVIWVLKSVLAEKPYPVSNGLKTLCSLIAFWRKSEFCSIYHANLFLLVILTAVFCFITFSNLQMSLKRYSTKW